MKIDGFILRNLKQRVVQINLCVSGDVGNDLIFPGDPTLIEGGNG